MNELYTTTEAAQLLKVKPGTLKSWRRKKTGPKHVTLGHKMVRYRLEDLEKWIRGRGKA